VAPTEAVVLEVGTEEVAAAWAVAAQKVASVAGARGAALEAELEAVEAGSAAVVAAEMASAMSAPERQTAG